MGGRGPAPSHNTQKTGHRKPDALRVLDFKPAEAPELTFITRPGGDPWPQQTLRWWDHWVNSPQAEGMAQVDWDYMLDTAMLHAQMWDGDTKLAGEIRLREAKYGATPEDRARLRMTYADADEKEDKAAKRKAAGMSSRERYGNLVPIQTDEDS
jgi:hypothetical protein